MEKQTDSERRKDAVNSINQIKVFLNDNGLKTTLKYLNTLTSNHEIDWIDRLCQVQQSSTGVSLSDIQLLREIVQSRVATLVAERDSTMKPIEISKSNIQWHSRFIESKNLILSIINKLSPLIGSMSKWAEDEEYIFSTVNLDDKANNKNVINPIKNLSRDEFAIKQNQLVNYYKSIDGQLEILEELNNVVVKICRYFANKSEKFDSKADLNDKVDSVIELNTAKKRIQFIESIYQEGNRNGKMTIDEALIIAKKKSNHELFKNEESFHNARRNLRIREENKRIDQETKRR